MSHPLSRPHTSPARSLRIFVVARDPAVGTRYQDALRAFGHQAFAVELAREAADLCRTNDPDLVVTDAELSDGCGYGLAVDLYAERSAPL